MQAAIVHHLKQNTPRDFDDLRTAGGVEGIRNISPAEKPLNKKRKTPFGVSCKNLLEASRGFEPLNEGFADPCLTTWPRRHFKELSGR